MTGSMVGADADALTATARQFGRSAAAIRQHRAQLGSIYSSAGWSGADADRTRSEWQAVGAPTLLRTSEFLVALEVRLLEHAAEQRRASAPSPQVVGTMLDEGVPRVDDAPVGPVGRTFGGVSAPEPVTTERSVVTGLRPSDFAAPDDGRGAVLAAMQGLADEGRIRRDEIEIRTLDNGRYVVVLPGVTDLSAGIDQFVDRVRDDPFAIPVAGRDAYDAWADNDEPTVRKMRYAFEAALRDDTTVNEYCVECAVVMGERPLSLNVCRAGAHAAACR